MSGIPSWAVRGARVVCVDGDIPLTADAGFFSRLYVWLLGARAPEVGEIVQIERAFMERGKAWLELVGFDGWSYEPVHFKPLVAPKSEAEDLAQFRHHLTQKIPEDAL